MAYVATEDYDGQDSDRCIHLTRGDCLTGVTDLDEYWLEGQNARTGCTGLFPKACVTHSLDEGPPEYTAFNKTRNDGYSHGSTYLHVNNNGDSKVRFSDVKIEHSISLQDSWQDSSFEDSFRTKLSNYDTIDENNLRGTKHLYNNAIEEKGVKNKSRDADDNDLYGFGHRPLGPLKNFMASTEQLINSPKDERKTTKTIINVIIGLLFGFVLVMLSVYSFNYSFAEAGGVVVIFTIAICLGLVFSSHCRCMITLFFPSLFTDKGRALMLSVLLSLMITHPVGNIVLNVKATGSSMACIADIAANQTRLLQEQLRAPIIELSEYISNQQKELQDASKEIRDGFAKVNSALDVADKAVDEANRQMNEMQKDCRSTLESTKSTCQNVCGKIKYVDVCGGVCNDFDTVLSSCDSLQITDTAITEAAKSTRDAIDESLSYFQVNISIPINFNGSVNTTRSVYDIEQEVNADIEKKARDVATIASTLNKFLSLSILLLFLQSFWYLRNYLAKDGYDNIYITKQFKELDQKNKQNGVEGILPLKKSEEDKYVNTSSWKLYACELGHIKLGFIIIGLHFCLFILVLIFDVSLWYILELVRSHSDVSIEVKGEGQVKVEVEGKGPVADFYRVMFKDLSVQQNFSNSIDIGACLPEPHSPNFGMVVVYIILYLITASLVILQGYGLRARRKICAYFFPEQEFARLDYLHKKIRHKRIGFLKFLRQRILSSHKEAQVKDNLRLSTLIKTKCPGIACLFPEKEKIECTSCEQTENSFNHIRVTRCNGKAGGIRCDAAYCQDCWSMLKETCPLCQKDEVVLRD